MQRPRLYSTPSRLTPADTPFRAPGPPPESPHRLPWTLHDAQHPWRASDFDPPTSHHSPDIASAHGHLTAASCVCVRPSATLPPYPQRASAPFAIRRLRIIIAHGTRPHP
ncbi:hypothetical protein NX059_011397 [Plenodomus lindquistii]|nr:hypothetical protein NX059_011397 [Plenodomus lindquistii]